MTGSLSQWFPVMAGSEIASTPIAQTPALEEEGGFGGQVELSSSVAGGGWGWGRGEAGLVDVEDPRAAGRECFL